MESRKSVKNLAQSIHSLLGFKTRLTSTWADSVCKIIKNLSSQDSTDGSRIKFQNCNSDNSEASNENEDADNGAAVSKIYDDLAALTAHLNELNLKKRQALNDFLDLKGNIRVFCRIRPILDEEKFSHLAPVVASDSNNVVLKLAKNKSKHYTFDKVFHQGSSQDEVFSEIAPVIKSVMDGYNVCIFAYGQTGTGKTFTMEGKPDCPGIVPHAINELFKQAVDSNHSFLFTFSMLEIYMGNLRDLLVPQMTKPTDRFTKCLSIINDPKGGIEIDNLVAIGVNDFNQAMNLYRLGRQSRSTASTNANINSSRSHCLIRISLTSFNAPSRRKETNKMWMIDLGGSERLLKTKAWGRRLEEGKAINLSLSALGDVISALQKGKPHVPYRNSKLTQVLRDSLGEDSKTLMLVHISPKEEDLCESVCSLGFATRVRSIHLGNEASVEVQAKKEIAMSKLLQKVKELESEGHEVRRDIKKLYKKLEHLTRGVSPYDTHLEALCLSNEVLQSNIEMEKHSGADVKASPSSKLPSFMRPTICSTSRYGKDRQIPEYSQKRIPLPGRRRRCTKNRPLPRNGISEYGSECSTSRTSNLMSLNMKHSTDYETEYSQDASECDIKMVVFPEQENFPKSLGYQAAHLIYRNTSEYANSKASEIDSSKCLTIDNRLHPQKKELNTGTSTHRTKWVPSIPVLEKTYKKSNKLQREKVHGHKITNKNVPVHGNVNSLDEIGATGQPSVEVVICETHKKLDELVTEESGYNSIPHSHTADTEVVKGEWGFSSGFIIRNYGCYAVSPPDVQYNCFNQYNDYSGVTESASKQIDTGGVHNLPEDFMFQDSRCDLLSSSDMGIKNILNLKEQSNELESQGVLTESSFESLVDPTEMINQKVRTVVTPNGKNSDGYCEKEDFSASLQYTEGVTRPWLHTMRCQRALLAELNDASQALIQIPERIHDTGMSDLLGQKTQTLISSALLGFGVQSLGLEHDFFYGLML
ncbi:kinesin-like protein KIN-14B isoform X2 [Telopea speciosissima]|uniref:kinesin-like protein KIN-14B isoform X2 n=1 Tax=Telopea speciosissima TaxID=54955 RepID=UPI001CC4DA47|nr:kinesin-like protein KIN-14B isoform X2 [Telopea speciosissima]